MKTIRLIIAAALLAGLTGCATGGPKWQGSVSGETKYGTGIIAYDGKTVRTDFRLPRLFGK